MLSLWYKILYNMLPRAYKEGMHHAYMVWHGKIKTGWQDMLNLDSVHYAHQVRTVNNIMETTIYSSIYEFCRVHAVHALFPIYEISP